MIPDSMHYMIRCEDGYLPSMSLQDGLSAGVVELFAEVGGRAIQAKTEPTDAILDCLKGTHVYILTDNTPEPPNREETIFRELYGKALTVKIITPTSGIDAGDIISASCKTGFDRAINLTREKRRNLHSFHFYKEEAPCRVNESAVADGLKREIPAFVLGGTLYLYEGGAYHPDTYGAELRTLIKRCLYEEFHRKQVIESIFWQIINDRALQARAEDLNRYPCRWVNFRNGYYDPVMGEIIPHDPRHKAVNQIPHDFFPGKSPSGPTVDRFLQQAIPDPEDREMLLQFVGYCMTTDTSLERFLIITGEGGTGKSTLLRLILYVIGEENKSSIGLQQLEQRFSAIGLMGKLLNCCADIPLAALEETSMTKRLTGEDVIHAEEKGKQGIDFRSYAKLIFSTNELPIVKGERSDGYYRRHLILTMNHKPDRTERDLTDRLKAEAPHFIKLCMDALGRMYRGGLTISDNSVEAVQRLRTESDTVEAFLNDMTTMEQGRWVERGKLFAQYRAYCAGQERTPLAKQSFFRAMRTKGFREAKSTGEWRFYGLTLERLPFMDDAGGDETGKFQERKFPVQSLIS